VSICPEKKQEEFFIYASPPVVFFFDVDNTLLDNDRVIRDLRRHLVREVGEQASIIG
jgi:hypothetical protein